MASEKRQVIAHQALIYFRWMSEKYDGIRAIWDGKRFVSRSSNTLQVPSFVTNTLPADTSLDGELWFGRGTLNQSLNIAKRAVDIPWDKLVFMVFDAPQHGGVFEGS